MTRFRIFTVLFVFFGLFQSWNHRWLSDDAFITFRYAKHWSEGHGLVYNIGEKVEGFTNLLWTLMLGLGLRAGLPPELLSHLLSIGCFAGLLLLCWQRVERKQLPIAMILAATFFHLHIFATSGLETMSFVLLIAVVGAGVERKSTSTVVVGNALAILTRPEGGLLWLLSSLFLSGKRAKVLSLLVGGGLLFLLTLWRWTYYGDIVPNTFHAKGASNWSQGLFYVGIFVQRYPWLLLAIAALFFVPLSERRQRSFYAAFVCLYALHVVRVGGDFMMARFCLPLVPYLLFVFEDELHRRLSTTHQYLFLAACVGLSLFLPSDSRLTSINGTAIGWQGVTEEHVWYPEEWRQQAEEQGKAVQQYLKDSNAKVMIYGGQAMFAYYAELPYVLEGMAGLTDKELARLPSLDGRVGHGNKVTTEYLQQRGIDLYIDFRFRRSKPGLNHIQLGDLSGYIFVYRKEVMATLRANGAQFVDFPEFLDQYDVSGKSTADIEQDHQFFQKYYFQRNNDPVRAARFPIVAMPEK